MTPHDKVLKVCSEALVYESRWSDKESNLSDFDKRLMFAWNTVAQNGLFRYRLNIRESGFIPGKWRFFAELNPERGEQRRKPQEISAMDQPYDPALFNFNHIKDGEILFRFAHQVEQEECHDIVVVNVSPITTGHCLVVPEVEKCHPQVLTELSIVLGLRLLLLSGTPAFRIAFNSMCAFASVNHLHLHCYYLHQSMLLEDIELRPLQKPCWQLTEYPAKGFVFQNTLRCESDIRALAANVFKLTSFLQHNSEPHNLYMTRSKINKSDESHSAVRVYVWARKPNTGAKEILAFNPAACELFGHMSYKSEMMYQEKEESSIEKILNDITSEPFKRLCPLVKDLYLNHSDVST